MHSSRTLWAVLGSLSLIAACVLAAGFVAAAVSVVRPPGAGLDPAPRGELRPGTPGGRDGITLVALGDSLTKGTGDAEGLGYPGRVRQQLAADADEPVYVINYAVEGYTTAQLLHDLQSRAGDIAAVAEADAIVLTIGGNDLFDLNRIIETGVSLEEASASMEAALDNIDAIVRVMRERNAQAPVYYVGLYNPFSDVPELAAPVSSFVQDWNREVERRIATHADALVVPTFDLFAYDAASFLSFDHYHPNAAGYERIAERVSQALAARFGVGERGER